MNKNNIPTCHATSIFEVDISFYKEKNIGVLLVDLDNTLDSYRAKVATKRTIDFVNNLKENGIDLILFSNNKEERVKKYADSIGVKYAYKIGKPFKKKASKFLADNKIDKNSALMVGDQVLTDIKCANKLGIRSLLVDKIVKEDQFVTKLNRIYDKIVRSRLTKGHYLRNWRVI